MAITFKRASKAQARLRLALMGAAGAGKTFSALAIAKGLGSRVALLDTEHGSASKYADQFEFDTLSLESFEPERYIEAIRVAEEAGFDVLILDSLTHAWAGVGGILEQKDRAQGDSFNAWRKLTPKHNALVEAILAAKLHVIATMRAKTEYAVEKDERGKTSVKKLGLGAVQRDGMEYEFDVVLMLDEATANVTKTRYSPIANKQIQQPGERLGRELATWLSSGAPVAAKPTPAPVASPAETPKTQPSATPGDEELLLGKIAGAETLEDLALARTQLTAAKPRLSAEAVKRLAAAYSAQKAHLESQAPPQGDEPPHDADAQAASAPEQAGSAA